MKTILKVVAFAFFVNGVISGSYAQDKSVVKEDTTKSLTFSSSQEAARQGKADLVALIGMTDQFQISATAEQIEASELGLGIGVHDVDFEKLLTSENKKNIRELSVGRKGNMTPLLSDKGVIAVIDTRKFEDGWRVSGLMNETIRNDLNEMGFRMIMHPELVIDFYEVPNIAARVYAVTNEDGTRYFSHYGDFSFRKSVQLSVLLTKLREDAIQFQDIYGDKLKKERLLR